MADRPSDRLQAARSTTAYPVIFVRRRGSADPLNDASCAASSAPSVCSVQIPSTSRPRRAGQLRSSDQVPRPCCCTTASFADLQPAARRTKITGCIGSSRAALPGGHLGRSASSVDLPRHHGADLHRAPHPQQPRSRALDGSQGGGGGAAPDLRRRQRDGGLIRGAAMALPARPLRYREVTRPSCGPGPSRLVAHVIPRLFAFPPEAAPRDLHDQCDREPARAATARSSRPAAYFTDRQTAATSLLGHRTLDQLVEVTQPEPSARGTLGVPSNQLAADATAILIHERQCVIPASHTEF